VDGLGNWRADHDDPLLLTRARGRSVIELAWPLRGCESWDHWDVRDPAATGTRLGRLVAAHTRRLTMWLGWHRLTRRIVDRHARHFGPPGATGRPVRRLLFVCYGNICRSPFAERLARARLDGCVVESAGVHATPNLASPERLVRLARTMGVDLGDGRSTRLDAAQVARADLILAMDPDTYAQLAAAFPEAVAKMTLLGLFARQPRPVIPDPYVMNDAETRDVLAQIGEAVDGLSVWLRGEAPTSPDAGPRLTLAAAVEAALAGGRRENAEHDMIDRRAPRVRTQPNSRQAIAKTRSPNGGGVPLGVPDREGGAPCVE
jgi:protein-tyrosine-phosphatase